MLDILFPSISSILCISLIGLIFGLILSIAKIKLHVEQDPRIEQITGILPGANCGSCGFPGCAGYAAAIVEQGAEINLCPACNEEKICRIGEIMGVKAHAGIQKIAVVHCHGDINSTKTAFIYDGPKNCGAAQLVMEGFKVCPYGCLGLGDCEAACPFDAIHVSGNGLSVVDADKCVGCGNCVKACPRNIIDLLNKTSLYSVSCRNQEKAPVMKLGCSVGCIACKKCVKACQEVFQDKPGAGTAIDVENFLAIIDYNKCINCGKCAEECPNKVIYSVTQAVKAQI